MALQDDRDLRAQLGGQSPIDWVGYALAALDDDQQQAVARVAATDARISGQIDRLHGRLELLAQGRTITADIAPSAALAEKTLVMVKSQPPFDLVAYTLGAVEERQPHSAVWNEPNDLELGALVEQLRERLKLLEAARIGDADLGPSDVLIEKALGAVETGRPATVRFRESASPTGPRRLRMIDALVAACVVLMVSMLLVPALNRARHQARVEQCAQNLQQIGTGLCAYLDQNPGWMPGVGTQGNLHTAGGFAIVLVDQQLIDSPAMLFCTQAVPADYPSLADVQAARPGSVAAAELLRQASGDYGYTLGYVQPSGQVPSSHSMPRESIPLVGDAPYRSADDSACSEARAYLLANSANHGGTGQNVLFAAGNVRFLETRQIAPREQDIFLNRTGDVRAGLDPHDAVLGFGTDRP